MEWIIKRRQARKARFKRFMSELAAPALMVSLAVNAFMPFMLYVMPMLEEPPKPKVTVKVEQLTVAEPKAEAEPAPEPQAAEPAPEPQPKVSGGLADESPRDFVLRKRTDPTSGYLNFPVSMSCFNNGTIQELIDKGYERTLTVGPYIEMWINTRNRNYFIVQADDDFTCFIYLGEDYETADKRKQSEWRTPDPSKVEPDTKAPAPEAEAPETAEPEDSKDEEAETGKSDELVHDFINRMVESPNVWHQIWPRNMWCFERSTVDILIGQGYERVMSIGPFAEIWINAASRHYFIANMSPHRGCIFHYGENYLEYENEKDT